VTIISDCAENVTIFNRSGLTLNGSGVLIGLSDADAASLGVAQGPVLTLIESNVTLLNSVQSIGRTLPNGRGAPAIDIANNSRLVIVDGTIQASHPFVITGVTMGGGSTLLIVNTPALPSTPSVQVTSTGDDATGIQALNGAIVGVLDNAEVSVNAFDDAKALDLSISGRAFVWNSTVTATSTGGNPDADQVVVEAFNGEFLATPNRDGNNVGPILNGDLILGPKSNATFQNATLNGGILAVQSSIDIRDYEDNQGNFLDNTFNGAEIDLRGGTALIRNTSLNASINAQNGSSVQMFQATLTAATSGGPVNLIGSDLQMTEGSSVDSVTANLNSTVQLQAASTVDTLTLDSGARALIEDTSDVTTFSVICAASQVVLGPGATETDPCL
jgi:hypothetical protein